MLFFERIKKGVPEFLQQSKIVDLTYGGNSYYWMLDMLWCFIRYGARPIDYVRFQFHKKSSSERNRYLTIYRYFRVIKHFGAFKDGVNGKIAEYKTYAEYIHREWLVLDGNISLAQLENFINKHKVVIAKPVGGDQGKGVVKIECGNIARVLKLLEDSRKEPYIVEELIKNCDDIAAINPSSLNTVRVTTLILRDGSTKIVSIILRVGRPNSHVDNWGAGGVGYNFDIETGICNQYGKDKKNRPYVYHPGSNVQMIGYRLPRFEELKQYVLNLSKVYPAARYVGWDVAITPNGFDLVEMNCPAGHDMFQSFDNPIYDLMRKNW